MDGRWKMEMRGRNPSHCVSWTTSRGPGSITGGPVQTFTYNGEGKVSSILYHPLPNQAAAAVHPEPPLAQADESPTGGQRIPHKYYRAATRGKRKRSRGDEGEPVAAK